ncbi:MAG: bestrophin [Nevskiaceae bacterium]|nr:MAG: bestrophin [Nevskiaceae bacterium]
MMVLSRQGSLRMFFAIRGSVLPRIAWNLLLCTSLAVVVTLVHGSIFNWQVTLTAVPFSLMGLALAIFLGFRNSAAYDRYWEGRKLWGNLLHRSRTLARQLQTLTRLPSAARHDDATDPRTRILRHAIAFAHTLRHQLRGSDPGPDLAIWLTPGERERDGAHGTTTQALLTRMGDDLGALLHAGQIDPQVAVAIDETLSGLCADAAGCERIRNTPVPFAYTLLLHRTAYLYCFLLPFGLVQTVGVMTPLVVAIVAYTFFGLDALGSEIEEPFGTEPNHLALDAICRTIEIQLLTALGATDLPRPLAPVDGCLL